MNGNPLLGVLFHWIGGLAAGSFYVPYKQVRKWAWEVFWLSGGFFSWIICPIVFGWLVATNATGEHIFFRVLGDIIAKHGLEWFTWPFIFGMMWGFGNVTFGLSMRYLGMSLGQGIALGYCTVGGTLLPPILKYFAPSIKAIDKDIGQIAATTTGQITLAGLAVTVIGIIIAARAGIHKEREMPEAEKKKSVAEFNMKRGIMVATFSGIMSAGMAFAITAGNPIAKEFELAGTPELWAGIPRLLIILLGGFTANFAWCVYLNIKNKSGYQYIASHLKPGDALVPVATANIEQQAAANAASSADTEEALRIPRLRNWVFSALGGATWYFQFFFYNMGESQMGDFKFASWTLHMASIIIFSTLWGVAHKEWSGVSKRVRTLIWTGISTLIFATIVIGVANWYDAKLKEESAAGKAKAAQVEQPAGQVPDTPAK